MKDLTEGHNKGWCSGCKWANSDILHIEANGEHYHTYVSAYRCDWRDAPTDYGVRVETNGETSFFTAAEARLLAQKLTEVADVADKAEADDLNRMFAGFNSDEAPGIGNS